MAIRAVALGLLLAAQLAFLAGEAGAQGGLQTFEVAASNYGDLNLNGSTTIDATTGTVTTTTNSAAGLTFSLNPSQALLSPFFSSAPCLFLSFSSNYSTLDVFVTTKTNLQTMLIGGTLDYIKAQPLPNGVWRNVRGGGGAYLALNTSDTYGIVMINTGGQDNNGQGSNSSSAVSYRAELYHNRDSVNSCKLAVEEAAASGDPASTESTQDNQNLATFLERDVTLQPRQVNAFAALDSATCASFQLLSQGSANLTSLDLSFFVTTVQSLGSWIASNYKGPYPYVGPVCQQTTNTAAASPSLVTVSSSITNALAGNATVSARQTCQINIDGLDVKQQYVLVGVNGIQTTNAKANATLRYATRGQGSCSSLAFPNITGVSFLGGTSMVMVNNTRLTG